MTNRPEIQTGDQGVRIDRQFDVALANRLARLESYNRHLYRPNSYLHKWWARRCGSTFRLILKNLVQDSRRQGYFAAGGLEGCIVLDPMIGGGTTLHEAIRLGANVIGADIDPIPILQARATLSRIPLQRLEEAFDDFFDQLVSAVGSAYMTTCRSCGERAKLSYVLYGLRRRCQCEEVIFVDSLILRHNRHGSVLHIVADSHDIYLDQRLVAASGVANPRPIRERGTSRCTRCGRRYQERLDLPYYRRYEPLVVVGRCNSHGPFFAPPDEADRQLIAAADAQRHQLGFDPSRFSVVPGPKSKSLFDRNVESYLDLFSSRQLGYLKAATDALAAFEPLEKLNLALLVSTSLEFNSMLCGYKGAHRHRPGTIRHVFSRHAYAFPYTSLENNPVSASRSSGTLQNLFHRRVRRGRQWAKRPVERQVKHGTVKKVVIQGETDEGSESSHFNDLNSGSRRFLLRQGSSAELDLPDDSVDYIVTDPPYFDNVQYSDLSAFFRVWLKQWLPEAARWDYPLADSAVNQEERGSDQYTTVLSDIFRECRRVLRQEGRLIFTFHHWKSQGWTSLTLALRRAGFYLINRYVVHAENRASVHIANQDALLHDLILVLAPTRSELTDHWEIPAGVPRSDGQAFCRYCGDAIGWMLQNGSDETDIAATWRSLLD